MIGSILPSVLLAFGGRRSYERGRRVRVSVALSVSDFEIYVNVRTLVKFEIHLKSQPNIKHTFYTDKAHNDMEPMSSCNTSSSSPESIGSKIASRRLEVAKKKWMERKAQALQETLKPVPPPLPKYEMPPLKTFSVSDDEIKQMRDYVEDSFKEKKKKEEEDLVDVATEKSDAPPKPFGSVNGVRRHDTDSKCIDAKNAFHSFFGSTLNQQSNGKDAATSSSSFPIGTSTTSPFNFTLSDAKPTDNKSLFGFHTSPTATNIAAATNIATTTTTTTVTSTTSINPFSFSTSTPSTTGSFSFPTLTNSNLNNPTVITKPNTTLTTSTESIHQSEQSYKERLLEFYTKYNPEKLSTVDETLEKYKGKEEEMFTKLYQKYTSSGLPPPMGEGSKVFMDITIGGEEAGRIVYKLYQDKTKKTADNFYYLCTGEKGVSKLSSKLLSYKNCSFHRIVPGFVIQGGDFTKHDGTGGESIYGGTADGDMWGKFKDEMFMSHSKKYLLSMANNGKDRNGSQFFITLKEKLSHLDGKHVVFGEVVNGFEVVDRIVENCVLKGDKPTNETKVVIVDCGKFEEGASHTKDVKEVLTSKKIETKHVSVSAGFPPMSSKAPTPFSFSTQPVSTSTTDNSTAISNLSSKSKDGKSKASSESNTTKSTADKISNPFANINLTSSSSTGISDGGFMFGFVNDKVKTPAASAGFNFKSNQSKIESDPKAKDDKEFSKHVEEDMEVSISKQKSHAIRAYDTIDTDMVGKLPISKLEVLLDEIGEGFHGDELEKQIKLLDPEGTGFISKSSFIQWYCTLDEASEYDDSSLDTGERIEREEERLKASETYDKVASNGGVLSVGDFGKLIEAMGTTYCEEEHQRTVRKISDKGIISKTSFVNWYMEWLFGNDDDDDDDSDYEDDSDSNDSEDSSSSDSSESNHNRKSDKIDSTKQGWGSTFSVEKDSWKCDVCMVRNPGNSIQCSACETLKPGCKGFSEAKDDKSKIDSTTFTFGFTGTTSTNETSTTPTFTFGFNPPSA